MFRALRGMGESLCAGLSRGAEAQRERAFLRGICPARRIYRDVRQVFLHVRAFFSDASVRAQNVGAALECWAFLIKRRRSLHRLAKADGEFAFGRFPIQGFSRAYICKKFCLEIFKFGLTCGENMAMIKAGERMLPDGSYFQFQEVAEHGRRRKMYVG